MIKKLFTIGFTAMCLLFGYVAVYVVLNWPLRRPGGYSELKR